MNGNGAEWLGEADAADSALVGRAPGGALSEAGRQAAIEASLSLLGVYFAGGDQGLVERSAIGRSEDDRELDALQAGLRLRVALAAGGRLASLLEAILKRPTFRYELRTAHHVGSLNGPLDVNRWLTQPQGSEELSYPVLEVQRGLHTPENVLAAYTAAWLDAELRRSLAASLATVDAIEYQAVRLLRDRLSRALRVPALSGCLQAAAAVRTRAAAEHLVSQVMRRLRRREVANAPPYAALAKWVDECLGAQPAVAAGDIDLAVYGDRFDNKLFELWCLGTLGRRLATALNLPEPSVDPAWRRGAPAYTLTAFSGRIDLYFQRSLRSVDEQHSGSWVKENGGRLGGIPDVVIRALPTLETSRYAIIDPKLRQRDRLPAEELYKILGYLQNFDIKPAVGILLIYTTSYATIPADVFHDSHGGTLISAAVNPAAAPARTAETLQTVIRTILWLIDYRLPETAVEDPAFAGAESADERVVREVKASVEAWGRSHLGEIASSRERIETLVGSVRWLGLADDVQVVMATADLVGHQLDPVADFSGPVIGMCTAIEHIIHTNVLTEIVGNDAARQKQTRTFGAALDAVELACRSQGGALHREIRAYLVGRNVQLEGVLKLMPRWRRMNVNYRIPAAHRQLLTKSDWQQLYRMLMGSETLFIQTFDILHPQLIPVQSHLDLQQRSETDEASAERLDSARNGPDVGRVAGSPT